MKTSEHLDKQPEQTKAREPALNRLRNSCARYLLPFMVAGTFVPGAYAGLIIASGDNTPAFYAGDASYDNGVFFSNILGAGMTVFVHEASTNTIGTNLSDYYNSLAGVTSTYSASSTITPASLTGVDLFVSGLFQDAFSASEHAAIEDYVQGGGSILLMGDYTYDFSGINAALAALGSGMSLVGPITDLGSNLATVLADPLTAGVTDFRYGATYGVSVDGGTSLFLDSTNRAFMAYEGFDVDVPEPGTLALLGAGLAGLGFGRRRRRA